jgi:hypothetical protein
VRGQGDASQARLHDLQFALSHFSAAEFELAAIASSHVQAAANALTEAINSPMSWWQEHPDDTAHPDLFAKRVTTLRLDLLAAIRDDFGVERDSDPTA